MVEAVAPLQLVYILVFAATAGACFTAIGRARVRLEDPDTKWGLVTLLATSGLWATFHVGRIAVPAPSLKLTFYVLGLITGLSTVGAWLYFCSAYAGKSYHRQPWIRTLALVVYFCIVGAKITSPIHGLYFSTTIASTPFTRLVINFGILHWVVTGLAYALSAVGFYILFDMFKDSQYATKRLGGLVAVAGLPVVFDLIGYLSPEFIITLNYEPIGVGIFAIGVLYVADGTFVAVRQFGREQLFDELGEGIVILDAEGLICDANDTAMQLFPALTVGRAFEECVPEVAEHLPVTESTVIELSKPVDTEYYLLSAQSLNIGQTSIGQALVFTDVTEVERQRRQLETQREQMDEFAAALSHELRNALTVIGGRLDFLYKNMDTSGNSSLEASIATTIETTSRMNDLVADLAMLARYGQQVETVETLDVATVSREVWADVAADGCRLETVETGTIDADQARVERLFENLFQFALQTGGTEVTLQQEDSRLIATSNGQPLTDVDVERMFAFGQAVPDADSGMLLPIVRTLAEAHGWSVTMDTAYQEGMRVVIEL